MRFNFSMNLGLMITILGGGFFQAAAQADIMAVRGAYENHLIVPPGVNPPVEESSSAAFFGGHFGPYAIPGSVETPQIPSNGTVMLTQSSFGQMVARDVPYPNFETELYNTALAMLYWEKAALADRESAAFVYKYFLYSRDSAEGYIEAQFSNIGDYWPGENGARRTRAWQAADLLLDALKYAPWNRELRWAVLDIYYDIAVADLAVAGDKLVEAYKISLELVAPPPGEFLISDEIEKLEEALDLYRTAIVAYFQLLDNPMGVDASPYTQENVPFGYYLFKEETPQRSLYSPLMKDGDGWKLPSEFGVGDTGTELFAGYKDLVMIFNAERDHATVAAELTRRYILRGMPASGSQLSDRDKAASLISTVQQQSYLEGAMLTGIFPEITGAMKSVDSDSGLLEAANSWRAKVSELNYLQAYLNGESNLLGFTDDFLALVQPPSGENTESYDYYVSYIKKAPEEGPLDVALEDLGIAESNYGNYRDRLDQLASQFQDKNETYDARLFEITGADPDEDPAGYATPFDNEGSELSLQWLSIEMAQKRIEANRQEIDSLQDQVEIEIWRRGQERGINDAIGTVYINYGNRQAKLTEEIGRINAAQTFANNIAQAFASQTASIGTDTSYKFSQGSWAYTANAFLQAGCEVKKAGLQADKERLGAQQSAEIQSLNDQLLDVNSKANIKTWLLRMNTLVIESEEAALSLEQEWGRLAGLLAEKEELERRKAESNEQLADRYCADPIHRLKKDSSIIRAEYTFQWAQYWMYLAVRALEYKWNKPFINDFLQKTYTANTLMGLRNANELHDMFLAMEEYDTENTITRKKDDSFTKFSFKRDFLGFHCSSSWDDCCTDPVTGEPATALEAFRSYLKQDALYIPPNPDRNINPLVTKTALRLTFSTVKENSVGVFFSPARWNEKIYSMRVKVFGAAPVGSPSAVGGYIRYGGTNFLRTANPGDIEPINPSMMVPEMRAYASKSWYKDGSTGAWRSRDYRSGAINVQLSSDPDAPTDSYEMDMFHEYSVANSEWILYIAVKNGEEWLLNLDDITDIEIHIKSRYNSRDKK